MKRCISVIFFVGIASTIIVMSSITIVTPEEMTYTRFKVIEFRIKRQISAGKVVYGLDTLEKVVGKDNSTKDGWGTPIRMYIAETNVLLHCYGEDRKPNISKDGDDLFYRFSVDSLE